MFVTCFQWRYHVILPLKKCVSRLHVTLYQGKRLSFISLLSVVFQKTLKNSINKSFLCTFFINKKTLINNEFFLALFIHFFWCCIVLFLIEHKTAHCLILKFIYEKKNYAFDNFWGHFWVPIAVDHCHFRSWCDADYVHWIKTVIR